MKLPKQFNAKKRHDESRGGELTPLPPDEYLATVNAIDESETSNGYKALVVTVAIAVEHNTRLVKEWLNIGHPNEVAQRISIDRLAALSVACGFDTLEDTDDLIGKEVTVSLDIDGKYNKIVGYRKHRQATTVAKENAEDDKSYQIDDDLPF